ncbi:UNKNOWN [Stylonychia lemnae]|uniref:Insertion element IS1 protein InsA helix-turn-helix domain-containing protein n=1 Tax=Stylonychia lemnae TaxID=5949 RepID=A0A078B1X6_STYLE|nr:UNKNOWN [Stylonychia lemnae]|eukprot:CDW88504.1 UNKNOWN [Stylonychia lemnae]
MQVTKQIKKIYQHHIEMAINGSGVRDTVRVLKVGINTVIRSLKKVKRATDDHQEASYNTHHILTNQKLLQLEISFFI